MLPSAPAEAEVLDFTPSLPYFHTLQGRLDVLTEEEIPPLVQLFQTVQIK